MNWFKKIKEIFEFPSFSKEYILVCLNCGSVFDKKRVDIFIKHQIDEEHYDSSRVNKTDNFIIDFNKLTNSFIVKRT